MLSLPPPRPLWTPRSGKSKKESPEILAIRQRAFGDYAFFIREFFPDHFWGEFSPFHLEVIEREKAPDRRGQMEVTAAPRGNAKTVFCVIAKVTHTIVYGYQPFSVIIGYSSAEAEDKVNDIKIELKTNERLIEVFGKQVQGGGKTDFTALNGCRVLARSRGGQVRGLRHGKYRPTAIYCDDVEDLEGVQSQLQRDKTKSWFFKDVKPAGQSGAEYKLNITFVGTILHEEALLPDLLKTPTADVRSKHRSIISWSTRQDLWDQWREIFIQLDNPNAKDDARAFYLANEEAMLEGTEVLWPDNEDESYYGLMVQQLGMGKAAFSSEKQNEPFDPDSQILDPDLCPRFKVYTPDHADWLPELGDEGFAIVRADTGKAVHSRDLTIVAFHDPAVGRETQNGLPKNDFAAVVVAAQDPSGFIYVLDCWLKRAKPDAQIKASFNLNNKWGIETLYLETVCFQELLRDKYELEQKNWEQSLRIVGVPVHSQGKARIISMEPYFANKWILMNENIDPEFLNQIRLFPTVHDDGPDALHGCVSRLRKPPGYIGIMDRAGEISGV